MVGHPVQVGAARGVRLGRHRPAVRVLRHPDDVGHHHPVVAVDEGAVEPVGHLRRRPAALHRVGAEDHQPRDVVHPPVLRDLVQGVRETAGVGGGAVELGEPLRHVLVRTQLVAPPVVLREVPVEVPHVVAPAHHLAHEALHRGDRRLTREVRRLGPAYDLERVEQAEVHRRRDQRVRHPRVALEHRVLVGTEARQPSVTKSSSAASASSRVAGNSRGPSWPMNETSPSRSSGVTTGSRVPKRGAARLGAPLLLVSPRQLQPEVVPQPSQTKQLPAGRILVPQVMQSGESTAVPVIFSKSSAEVWASPTPALAGTSRASAPWVSLVSRPSSRLSWSPLRGFETLASLAPQPPSRSLNHRGRVRRRPARLR